MYVYVLNVNIWVWAFVKTRFVFNNAIGKALTGCYLTLRIRHSSSNTVWSQPSVDKTHFSRLKLTLKGKLRADKAWQFDNFPRTHWNIKQRIAVCVAWASAVVVKLLRRLLTMVKLELFRLWIREPGIKPSAPLKFFSQGTSFIETEEIIKSKENAGRRKTGHPFWNEQQRKFSLKHYTYNMFVK